MQVTTPREIIGSIRIKSFIINVLWLSKRYFVNCRGDWVRNTLCEAKGGLGPPHRENLMDKGMGSLAGWSNRFLGPT